jgi:hypothetical protein
MKKKGKPAWKKAKAGGERKYDIHRYCKITAGM